MRFSRVTLPCLAALLGAFTGCDRAPTGPPVPSLPFNVRPNMAYLKTDYRELEIALKRGDLQRVKMPAKRIQNTWLGRGYDDVHPAFRGFEKIMRAEAGRLLSAAEQGDLELARAQLATLTRNCNDCHTKFRPGGASELLFR